MTSALTRRLYAIALLALSAITLAYFMILLRSAQGTKVADLVPPPPQVSELATKESETVDPALSQAMARMTAEIRTLKSALEATQKENADLKRTSRQWK